MNNPNNTAVHSDAGGKSKIKPTEQSGMSYQGRTGYGFMSADLKTSPKDVNKGVTLPVASPVSIMTHGDPNNTSA